MGIRSKTTRSYQKESGPADSASRNVIEPCRVYDAKQTASVLGVSRQTIARWKRRHGLPLTETGIVTGQMLLDWIASTVPSVSK